MSLSRLHLHVHLCGHSWGARIERAQSAGVAGTEQETSGDVAAAERPQSASGAREQRAGSVRVVREQRPTSVDCEVMGSPPPNATHWRLRRQVQGLWQQCQAGDDDVEVIEWPLSELSLAGIRERWGAGTYRVTWMASSPKCKPVGTGRPFGLKPLAPPPAPVVQVAAPQAPAPAGSPLGALTGLLPPELATTFALLHVLDGIAGRRADAQIELARMSFERDLRREQQRTEDTKAYYRELNAGRERERDRAVAQAAQQSAAKVKDETRALVDEIHERLDGMDVPEGGGGEKGLLAALGPYLPQLVQALQQAKG